MTDSSLTSRLRRAAREVLRPETPATARPGGGAPVADVPVGTVDPRRPATYPAPFAARAWVVASNPVADDLGLEWDQYRPTAAAWRAELAHRAPDLLLVEVSGGTARGIVPVDDAAEIVAAVAERGAAVVALVTGDGDLPAWATSDHVRAVLVTDAGAQARLAASTPAPVEVVGAAVQPRTLTSAPPRAAAARRRTLAVAPGTSLPDPVVQRLAMKPSVPVEELADLGPAGLRRLGGARALVTTSSAPELTAAAGVTGTPVLVTAPDASAEDARVVRSEAVALIEQAELGDRLAVTARRAALRGMTTRDRAAAALAAAGLPAPATPRDVSAIVPTNRDHEIDNVLRNLGRQEGVDVELVLVLHGLDTNDAELRARATDQGVARLEIVHADASLTLGACMNLGVDAAAGTFVAKMDDDNIYGPAYLADLVDAFRYTDAQIVGKWAHYVWLRSTGAVVLRYPDAEHTYERRIQGGSMLFQGDLVREVRFSDIPRAVDSDILDRSMATGASVYSADRFNFVSVRGTDRTQHTWTVTDATFFTAKGDLRFFGDPTEHVTV
ncbi:glycosyltransferase family A protein [Luteimicrobium subarcticum]|uniref:Glycosyl transferase family 2 n=1 Tax=Luteimicrobium subarcticum TaxID=620910 RepID=A0A2M8WTI0_9MICO|nr:glycosyltransferase family A protein [Luteimicrobium subarcticum]PJI94257.1 glycosyl transferase family 2 [Luteimicrobium subarcticum]